MASSVSAARGVTNVIVGGVLLHLTLGTLYSWGCIQPYVTSYIRLFHPSVTASDTTMIYACGILGHSIVMPLVGLLQFTLGLRGCAGCGCSLVSLATILSSLATSVAALAFLNALFGVGIAFAYTCPLVCGYAWTPNRKGAVSGFIVAGFGAGAAVFNGVATAWVNPDNASPDPLTGYYDEKVAGRVPGMYLVLGTCYLVLGIFGSWMLSPPPASVFTHVGSKDVALTRFRTRQALINDRSSASVGDYASLDSSESPGSTEGRRISPLFDSVALEIAGKGNSIGTHGGEKNADATSNGDPRDVDSCEGHFLAQDHVVDDGRGAARAARAARPERRSNGDSNNSINGNIVEVNDIEARMNDAARRGFQGQFTGKPPYQVWELLDLALATDEAGGNRSVEFDSEGTISVAAGEVKPVGDGIGMQRQFKTRELLVERDYYHLAMSFMLTAVTGLFIAGNYKHIAQQRFPDADRFLSVMGSFASLFNASGRVFGGLAVDRFGCFATLLVMSLLTTGLLLMYGAAQASKPSFFAIICLLHMLYGSNFAIYPTLTAEFFGATTAGPNYGLVFMSYGLGSFVVMLFLARINGSSKVFLVCAAISLAGVVSVGTHWRRRFIGKRERRRYRVDAVIALRN